MRNVSGYLTDDGRFFQDKKEAEAHERLALTTQRINKFVETDRKSTRLNSSHSQQSRMPSSA